jgi:hypothetical protein
MKQSLIRPTTILFAFAALAGCSETTSTSASPVAGSYTAIVFTTTGTSGQTNQLLVGSSLDIVLEPDGTTSGHLHRTASGGLPDFDADMAGTWTQQADVIRFAQAADTFVRDMPFTVEKIAANEFYLVGDETFAGTRINLTLAREHPYERALQPTPLSHP